MNTQKTSLQLSLKNVLLHHRIFVINAPWYLRVIVAAGKAFVHPITAAKVVCVGTDWQVRTRISHIVLTVPLILTLSRIPLNRKVSKKRASRISDSLIRSNLYHCSRHDAPTTNIVAIIRILTSSHLKFNTGFTGTRDDS